MAFPFKGKSKGAGDKGGGNPFAKFLGKKKGRGKKVSAKKQARALRDGADMESAGDTY